ncbi:MAG: hypothetical protein R3D98_08990 [Candidatus Krumholzibacteriia bacterium]
MDIKMGLHQGLHMKQQIVMTQRLQQALKLLQVPTLELEQILRTELQANPLLEEVERDDDLDEESDRDEAEETEPSEAPSADAETSETVDWDEYFKDGFRGPCSSRGSTTTTSSNVRRPTSLRARSTCSTSSTSP